MALLVNALASKACDHLKKLGNDEATLVADEHPLFLTNDPLEIRALIDLRVGVKGVEVMKLQKSYPQRANNPPIKC